MEVLQKKFDEFQKDMANNEDRVAEVNQTADTLIMEQHPDGDAIQKKREVCATKMCRRDGNMR